MNSLNKDEGVPILNFVGGPRVPLSNFEGCPGVPLLNFRGVPSPIFKLWGGSRVPGPKVAGPGILVPLLHDAVFIEHLWWLVLWMFKLELALSIIYSYVVCRQGVIIW